MKTTSNNTAKTGITTYGVRDPMNIEMPMRISTNPKYIGFLVIRKIPQVIKTVDTSNGLTVVLCFLNALSAMKFATRPNAKGKAPNRFQGKGMIFEIGNRKCRAPITKIDTNK
jgi:hypothetical protein